MAKKKKQKDLEAEAMQEVQEEESEKKNKLITLSSTQMWSPVKDIKDGIVITKDGRYVQILEFSPINFHLRPEEDQYAIADHFGASLRIFPSKFQIKVLSRKANVENHIRTIKDYMANETNPRCRQMQEESIRQIRSDAAHGVSKRFFIAFEYETPGGLRRSSWHDIRANLAFQSNQVAQALLQEPCANTLLSPIGDSDHTLGVLYECMSRAEAEIKPLDVKVADVVCSYLVQGKLNDNQTIPINDFIAPQSIDPSDSQYLLIDGKYYAFGYIERRSYPTRCAAGWMAKLIDIGEGIDVDLFVEKVETAKINQKLTYSMRLNELNYNHSNESNADAVDMAKKLEAGKYIREGLANDQHLCYFSIMVTVVAPSAEELRKKVTFVKNTLLASGIKLKMTNFHHDQAFKASMPLCKPDPSITRKAKRNILSGDLGAAYPLTSFEINDRDGIMFGRNRQNLTPVFINPFDRTIYENGNMAIFGSSGSGKTYLLQLMALRLRQQLTQTIIIAPYKGHEFRSACKSVGGEFVSIAPGSPQNINIMEIRKYDTSSYEMIYGEEVSKGSLLTTKIQQLLTFFSLLHPDMTKQQRNLLDEAIKLTYHRKGITEKNKSLIDPKNPSQYKEMPILGDLYKELSAMKNRDVDELCSVLRPFVQGSAKSFNAQTNVNLDNPYVVIDVSTMSNEMLPIGIFIATDFVYDTIKADFTQRKAVIIDELSRLIGVAGSEESAEFVTTLMKTVRAMNCCCIVATQDVNDFFALDDGKYGKGILANAKIKISMKMEPSEARTLGRLMELSDAETANIQHFRRGSSLVIANRNHALIDVVASPLEHDLITTDPDQLRAQLDRKAKNTKGGSGYA